MLSTVGHVNALQLTSALLLGHYLLSSVRHAQQLDITVGWL